ncbi:MAG TPA: ATP-binding protein [Thermoanaerobaculia bacterium]
MTFTVAAAVAYAVGVALAALRLAHLLGVSETAAWAVALFVMIPIVLSLSRSLSRTLLRPLVALDDGLRAFRDGDFSMRLAAPESDDEVTNVKRLYNEVADTLRAQRTDIYQKELLLDTILQRTPVAVVLVNAADRIVYSNAAARELLAGGGRLDGHRFAEVTQGVVAPVREALLAGRDTIVAMPGEVQDETIHVAQRLFRLNTLEHRLVLVERLTTELRRQEVAVWKKAIRVINHELNNTVAPISSLFHSARIAQQKPERREMLEDIYATIEERLAFLRTFLESYAQFARLPAPRKERTTWRALLNDVRALYAFDAAGDVDAEAFVDVAQMQQVLINLVKNAHESGSEPAKISVTVRRTPESTLVRITDAGRGMPDAVLRQALVPFYSTRTGGTGVGLALSNEIIEAHGGRLRLQSREGEGTVVTIALPS